MKRYRGRFQISAGLALSLLFLIVLPACKTVEVHVTAQCGPSEAMRDNSSPPEGMPLRSCNWDGNTCTNKPSPCACRK